MSDDKDIECKWVCKDRKEEYSPWNLFYELIIIIPAFLIGIYALIWLPIYGIIFSLFYACWSFGCYFVVFRIVLCPNCYYYGRWCPDGMGKFAKKVYGIKGDIKNYKKALLLPTIGWVVIVIFPIIIMSIYFIIDPQLTIPLFFNLLDLEVPIILCNIIFTTFFLLYFLMHKFLSCKGCAHVNTCYLSKVPLPQLFFGIIVGLLIMQITALLIL